MSFATVTLESVSPGALRETPSEDVQREATNGFTLRSVEHQCTNFAKTLYPDAESIHLAEHQGGCSCTLLIQFQRRKSKPRDRELGHERILQFRARRFDLDIALVRQAVEIYGNLVPLTVPRGVAPIAGETRHVYEMSVVFGVRLSELLPGTRHLDGPSVRKLERLLRGLAGLFAAGLRRDTGVHQLDGRVGSSIIPRLQKLSRDLPTRSLRAKAQTILEAVQSNALGNLPVVLSHGDLLPSNAMVDPETWELRGLIDWAEAEYLPFGISLYGLHHLLGFLERRDGAEPRWMWYEQSNALRDTFWEILADQISASQDLEVIEGVWVAQDVGVLLWHGFAWDDGRIDRVVNAADDKAELEILRAFLEER